MTTAGQVAVAKARTRRESIIDYYRRLNIDVETQQAERTRVLEKMKALGCDLSGLSEGVIQHVIRHRLV